MASAPPGGGVPASPPPFDTLTFVFHIDIVLLAAFGLYVLLNLPRVCAFLCRASELRNGHFLRSGGALSAYTQRRGVGSAQSFDASSINLTASNAHLVREATRKAHGGHPPIRMLHLSTLIHPSVNYALNYRVVTGFSVGKISILAIYLGLVFYAAFYKSNPFVEPQRAAFVAVSQIPIVVSLGTKNNILSYFSGLGYEKLNYIHRFGGRLVALGINVHALGFIYRWSIDASISAKLQLPFVQWGLVGLAGIDILAICSLPFVRQRFYNLFYISHIIGFFAFLVAAYMHFPVTIPFVITGFALYGFDHVLRVLKTRSATSTLTAIPAIGSTRVSVPTLRQGWHAGQHVRVRVVSPTVSSRLGWLGYCWAWLFTRARPFTISTASGGEIGLELIVKKRPGGWTGSLFDMAQPHDNDVESKVVGTGLGRDAQILIEGPYGGPGYTLFESYSGALLVAGGSGITFVLSMLSDLLQRHEEGCSRLRVIEVVWSVADPSALVALLPTLIPFLLPRPSANSALEVHIAVHYTRTPRDGSLDQIASLSLPPSLTLHSGRPNLGKMVTKTIDNVLSAHLTPYGRSPPSGVITGACGPIELGDEVAKAVGSVGWGKAQEVGGVEAYEEAFGW